MELIGGEKMLEPEIVMEQGLASIPGLPKRSQLLVVDDNEVFREALSRALSLMGYDVTLAGNGLEASTLFLSGAYDLVVTDLQMPIMNGSELSRLVKEKSPDTPVIVVTGCCDETLWEKLNSNSVDAIIPKPFEFEEIETTVQKLLSSGTEGRV
jgi:CheY-like chemotaxis protein